MIIKSQIVLYLYDKLVAKEKLYIDEIIGEELVVHMTTWMWEI